MLTYTNRIYTYTPSHIDFTIGLVVITFNIHCGMEHEDEISLIIRVSFDITIQSQHPHNSAYKISNYSVKYIFDVYKHCLQRPVIAFNESSYHGRLSYLNIH